MVARTALLLATVLLSAFRAEAGPGNSFEFRPGVLINSIDSKTATAYLMSPGGGMDAVDINSGKKYWHTDLATKPLLLVNNLLVAQTETQKQLRIALLNTRNIDNQPRYIDIPLPAGIVPGIDDQMESSFRVSAKYNKDIVLVNWRHSYRHATGARTGQLAGRNTMGSARINISSGKLLSFDNGETGQTGLPADTSHQHKPATTWQVGNIVTTIKQTGRGRDQRIVLKRRNVKTGESLNEVPLSDKGLAFRSVSADGHHLLASRRVKNGNQWLWVIFSLETGKVVASLEHDSPAARFMLFGKLVVHETSLLHRQVNGRTVVQPIMLRAIDASTSTGIWSHAVRDTSYRGPLPPSGARGP